MTASTLPLLLAVALTVAAARMLALPHPRPLPAALADAIATVILAHAEHPDRPSATVTVLGGWRVTCRPWLSFDPPARPVTPSRLVCLGVAA